MRSTLVLIAVLVAVFAAAPAHAEPGRAILVGAAEDAAKQGDPVAADAKMAPGEARRFQHDPNDLGLVARPASAVT